MDVSFRGGSFADAAIFTFGNFYVDFVREDLS